MTASSDTQWFSGYGSGGAFLPFDAVVAVLLAVMTDLLLVSSYADVLAIVAPLSALLLFFLPGYALLGALFPSEPSPDESADGSVANWQGNRIDPLHSRTLTLTERLALSVGVSLLLLPVVAIGLSVSGVGYEGYNVSSALTLIVFVGMFVGTVRRWRLPEHERFRLRPRVRLANAYDALAPSGYLSLVTSALVAVALLAAVSSVGFALVVPNNAESYTGVSVLTENESGELVAGGYPSEIEAGQPTDLVLEVENHERQTTDYSVVVQLQRVDQGDGSTAVSERQRLAAFNQTVDAGDAWRRHHRIAPAMTGEDMRLTYLVYRGDAPDQPRTENAYRHVHLWISVTEGE